MDCRVKFTLEKLQRKRLPALYQCAWMARGSRFPDHGERRFPDDSQPDAPCPDSCFTRRMDISGAGILFCDALHGLAEMSGISF